jgi:eukaryotic-like serine/threonine-protein kinase
MFCTACGTQMFPGMRFCRRCGAMRVDSKPVAGPLAPLAPLAELFGPDKPPQAAEPEIAEAATDDKPAVRRLSNKSRLLLFGSLLAIAMTLGTITHLSRRVGSNVAEAPAANAQAENAESTPAAKVPDVTKVVPPVAPLGMAYVPGGEFSMGYDKGSAVERPSRRVTVKPFFIDLYEVTCEEYKKFITATGHRAPACWINRDYPRGWAKRPVTGVDWDDASAYAAWAGKRLPTEAEWEFAARGSDGRRYPWGSQWKVNAANADSTSHKHPDNVGVHKAGASPFGVFDLAGNAWEWTASDYTDYATGGARSDQKVIRGGSWAEDRQKATATFRLGLPARGSSIYGNLGFRCASDITTSQVE